MMQIMIKRIQNTIMQFGKVDLHDSLHAGGNQKTDLSQTEYGDRHKQSGQRLGDCLLGKGILTQDVIEHALAIQKSENGSHRRKFGEILIADFGVERDDVYRTLAEIYAFPEINFDNGALKDSTITSIHRFFGELGTNLKQKIRDEAVLPFSSSEEGPVRIINIAAADPTTSLVTEIASTLGYSRSEVHYCQLESIQSVFDKVLPLQNEFLQHYENTPDEFEAGEEAAAEIDEIELDAEINRSKLTNLIEGSFVDAVNQGASDIHFIPKTGTHIDI